MHEKISYVTIITILTTTALLLILGSIVVYALFRGQKKKFQHAQELFLLRETFSKTLLQSKLEIQEQTLDHIAKELHANFSHLLSVININLSTLPMSDVKETGERIAETKSLVKQLMSELKALSVGLNTDHIMHIGFLQAMENELNRLAKTNVFKVITTKTGSEYKLPAEKEIILFRMCQEILNNIVKHSNATTISVLFEYAPKLFRLEMADDGKGFDVEKKLNNAEGLESTGLRNIYSRAALIAAEVDIFSQPGNGCKTIITIAEK